MAKKVLKGEKNPLLDVANNVFSRGLEDKLALPALQKIIVAALALLKRQGCDNRPQIEAWADEAIAVFAAAIGNPWISAIVVSMGTAMVKRLFDQICPV